MPGFVAKGEEKMAALTNAASRSSRATTAATTTTATTATTATSTTTTEVPVSNNDPPFVLFRVPGVCSVTEKNGLERISGGAIH